jgi:hypothetical protein
MRTTYLLSTSLFSLVLVLGLPQASSAAIQGAIQIQQISPSSQGTWTLLSEDGTSISSDDAGDRKNNYSVAITRFGQTTLSVVPPPSMSGKISVYRGGVLLLTTNTMQHSFNLVSNDSYRFVIQYSLTGFGLLGITSDPSGVRFRLRGPLGRTYGGTSPQSFEKLPVGKYIIMFGATKDCLQPPRKNATVKMDERTAVNITLPCTSPVDDTVDRTRTSKRSLREYAEDREYNSRGNRK